MKKIIIGSIIFGVMMAMVHARIESSKNLYKKQEVGYWMLASQLIVVPNRSEVRSANHPNADNPVHWATFYFKERKHVLWSSTPYPELGLS